jgi:hypothetical protein
MQLSMQSNSLRAGVLFLTIAAVRILGQEILKPEDITDPAILESHQGKKELPCSVSPLKPVLRYDLGYRAGYSIAVPLKELASGTQLLIVTRVTRQDGGKPVHFLQRVAVGRIPENTDAVGEIAGHFDIEEGRHRVDLLLRDRQGRACSSMWSIHATSPANGQAVLAPVVPPPISF